PAGPETSLCDAVELQYPARIDEEPDGPDRLLGNARRSSGGACQRCEYRAPGRDSSGSALAGAARKRNQAESKRGNHQRASLARFQRIQRAECPLDATDATRPASRIFIYLGEKPGQQFGRSYERQLHQLAHWSASVLAADLSSAIGFRRAPRNRGEL